MSLPFSRSLRSLSADLSALPVIMLAAAAVVLVGWGVWALEARFSLHETTEQARLEVQGGFRLLRAPGSGSVISAPLSLGAKVAQGDVVLTLRTPGQGDTPLRAPVAGVVGSVATLQPGNLLQEGDLVGSIVPEGQPLKVVAQFDASRALGRLHPGQKASLRLPAFPWAQWGRVPARVSAVATEPVDGKLRVELLLEASDTRIPLQHGLLTSVDVNVEELTPAGLLQRAAGLRLESSR